MNQIKNNPSTNQINTKPDNHNHKLAKSYNKPTVLFKEA